MENEMPRVQCSRYTIFTSYVYVFVNLNCIEQFDFYIPDTMATATYKLAVIVTSKLILFSFYFQCVYMYKSTDE